MSQPTVVVAGLGDTGIMVATRLARRCRVIGVTTRPALVSGQELGMRLTDPERWGKSYLVPLSRFRRLDDIEVRQGRVTSVDLAAATVEIESAVGDREHVHYDVLVIATGVSNGFWRNDRVEGLAAAEQRIADDSAMLRAARKVAVIGGGATAVSVADNVARRGGADVHLFFPGDELLAQHHPSARRWVARRLRSDGVTLHPGHRAVTPGGGIPSSITQQAVEWETGQPSVEADAVLWAIGRTRPHTSFLPSSVLDNNGFVRVDQHLQVDGQPKVFAVGDVAASDPLRSSARNWGHRVVVSNVRAVLRGRPPRRRFRAPKYRWGSILGLQREGLTVATAAGPRFRVPRRIAERVLLGWFVSRVLYGGIRRAPAAEKRDRTDPPSRRR